MNEPKLVLVARPEQLANVAPAKLTAILRNTGVAVVRIDPTTHNLEGVQPAVANAVEAAKPLEIPVLIRNHAQWVKPLGVAGAQIGLTEESVQEVRAMVGNDHVVGFGPITRRHTGMQVAEAGVDYVSLGPLIAEPDSGVTELASYEFLHWWSELIQVPCLAEGGITPQIASTIRNLVDFIAVNMPRSGNLSELHRQLREFAMAVQQ